VVATYNVKNLFDDRDDPYSTDEQTVPVPKPMEEVRALAEVIRTIDADVLALQEVESRGVLRRFKNGLLKDLRYGAPVHYEGNDRRGIDVAVLTRYPVGPVTSFRHLDFERENGMPARFSRDLLRVRVCPRTDFWFDLYVVHFKSGSGEENRIKREAEAKAVREILDRELECDREYPFLIVGDFNDGRTSGTIEIIEGEGDTRLPCLTDELDDKDQLTFFRGSRKARLDYIFCSPSMHRRYVESSVRVMSGEETKRASDHRPVVATFRVLNSM
jgi:endonuclease/exonuclease/phosphatase family metal-dependent hydrolase